ncbi:hypothetical protein FRX31_025221 [Thalictrum thalictroides]|uniref:Uncharacterized protein n=1 Tax=Thalictrum thalictroides TaxID=46969 RepID=A0A7J6VKA9_THATH|nr:hypothetical protein FRX31_025221 [Thalictrum thalictroides]
MAELPSNLDDGELWVPSGILPNGNKSDKIKLGEEEEEKFPSELTYMEELAQQLSSNALLHQQQTKTHTQTQTQTNITKLPNPKLQVEVKPFLQIGSFQPNQAVLSVVNNVGHGGSVRGTGVVHSVYASDQGGYRVEMIPRYHLPPIIPATAITQDNKNFVQPRGGGVYHKQLNQGRNSFLPFQANVGGFVKGTGVFFPRVEATTTIEAKKKQGVKNEENQCRIPVKKNAKNDVGKKEVVGLKASSDIVLPQEWTY